MEWILVGGDRRFEHLAVLTGARMVGKAEATLSGVVLSKKEAIKSAGVIVLNSPVKADISLEEITRIAPAEAIYVFAGPREMPRGFLGKNAVDLSENEWFLTQNAELTAEGAIVAAANATERAIRDWNCLVIGWGRIGRALTERLVPLGARVSVASRGARGRMQALARGALAADTNALAQALAGKHVVFSTPPFAVLGAEELLRADAGTLLIDLASPPYGIDLEAAKRYDLRAWREPGLPGRYSPVSAAHILKTAIERAVEGGTDDG